MYNEEIAVSNLTSRRFSRLCAVAALVGLAISGCFPDDRGAEPASMNLPLTNLGASPSAVNHWLTWLANQEKKLAEEKLPNFDLGPVGADFYLGIHVDNASELFGQSVTYDEANNMISVVVYVNECNECDFRVTIFIVETTVGAAAPVRMVSTFSGTSPIITVAPAASADVTMDVQQLPTGQIKCQPVGAVADGYEIVAIDENENVSFPSVTRISGSADPSVLLPNIPIARPMILQGRRTAVDEFVNLFEQDGTQIEPSIDNPNETKSYEFVMP